MSQRSNVSVSRSLIRHGSNLDKSHLTIPENIYMIFETIPPDSNGDIWVTIFQRSHVFVSRSKVKIDFLLNEAHLPITETIYIKFESNTSIYYGDMHHNILQRSEVTVPRSNVKPTSNLDGKHLHTTEMIYVKFGKDRLITSAQYCSLQESGAQQKNVHMVKNVFSLQPIKNP